MRISLNFFFVLLVAGSLLWQCSETKEVDPNSLGTEYYPLKTGIFRVYDVHGVKYNSVIDSVEFSYLLKETITDSFTNLESGISYILERQKKYEENGGWEIDSIWTSRKDDRTATLVENNVAIVSLTFPLVENKTWDGNKLNGEDEAQFEMKDIQKPYEDSYGYYQESVTVIQDYLPPNVVNYISQKEIYARGIGLVYKENVKLEYQQNGPEGIIRSGLKYYQHLLEYGEE